MRLGRPRTEMAVYGCWKLIYPQATVRAADQTVAKKQFFNFGVWGSPWLLMLMRAVCVGGGLPFGGSLVVSVQPRGLAAQGLHGHPLGTRSHSSSFFGRGDMLQRIT